MRLAGIVLSLAALTPVSAHAITIRELAQYEQPALVTHIMGSVTGAAAGLRVAGNTEAADCVRRWALPPTGGNGDPQALTDILTRIADVMGHLGPASKAPEYEDVLAAALRKRCGPQLPTAR